MSRVRSISQADSAPTQLPNSIIWAVVAICVLPSGLNAIGIDFSVVRPPFDLEAAYTMRSPQLQDAIHHTLAGSFIHTLLEWSAFCAAIFTVALAFSHFTIKRNVITPILSVTLLCAGIMDAFHTLAADRLINAAAETRDLIPFTWAMCRLGNALLTISGVGLLLLTNPKRWKRSIRLVCGISFGFGVLAYSVIYFCTIQQTLPQTMYPQALVTRPWDVLPLMLFTIAGFCIYPILYRRHPSLFAHALVISTIPNSATQIHMAFGSSALFDNHFNIAHFLKIIAYLVPLIGLILDYTHTHREVRRVNRELRQEIVDREMIQSDLQLKSNQLEQTLQELKQAQLQLIQTEKMSSLGQMVAGIAHEINNPVNFIHGNLKYVEEYSNECLSLLKLYEKEEIYTPEIESTKALIDLDFIQDDFPKMLDSMRSGTERIRSIVNSLRVFSRLDEADLKTVDIHEGIESTLLILQKKLEGLDIELILKYEKLPQVECYSGQLNQVFFNLISNAIDALEEVENRSLTISTLNQDDTVLIEIHDTGLGISDSIKSNIFDPFFTTKPVGKGTGLGLSISYQIITERHQGKLTCHSDHGTTFRITIPTRQAANPLN